MTDHWLPLNQRFRQGVSWRHLTPLFSSEHPELEPRGSKKIDNLSEDREFLSLEMMKRQKDKDIPLLEGQRSLLGFYSPPAKRVPVTKKMKTLPHLPRTMPGGVSLRQGDVKRWYKGRRNSKLCVCAYVKR